MSNSSPRVKFVLLKDFRGQDLSDAQLEDLHRQLQSLPDFSQVEIAPRSNSTVIASVPSRNKMQSEKLKALVNERIPGWKILEEQNYQLPTTF